MIVLTLLASVLVLASSQVVKKPNANELECSIRGAMYWCQNEVTAKQCGTTSFCEEQVWSKKEVQELGHRSAATASLYYQQSKVGGFFTCKLCKFAMGKLESILGSKTTEAKIIHSVENLCDHLPASMGNQCKSLIETYSGTIIQALLKEMQPAVICKFITLCKAENKNTASAEFMLTAKKPLQYQQRKVGGYFTCKLCMFAMGKLDAILGDKTTETKIIHSVETLCDHLPASTHNQCKSLIETYGDTIIQALLKEMQPAVICKFITLCKAEDKKVANTNYMLAKRMSLKGVSCQVCQYGMGYLDKLIESGSVETKIETSVVNLCSHLPATFKNECDALITEYGDNLVKLVVKEFLSPAVVCKELTLC